jgi:hypothetical protein
MSEATHAHIWSKHSTHGIGGKAGEQATYSLPDYKTESGASLGRVFDFSQTATRRLDRHAGGGRTAFLCLIQHYRQTLPFLSTRGYTSNIVLSHENEASKDEFTYELGRRGERMNGKASKGMHAQCVIKGYDSAAHVYSQTHAG